MNGIERLVEAIGKKGLAWVVCAGLAYIGGGLARHKGLLIVVLIAGGVGASRGGVLPEIHWPQWPQNSAPQNFHHAQEAKGFDFSDMPSEKAAPPPTPTGTDPHPPPFWVETLDGRRLPVGAYLANGKYAVAMLDDPAKQVPGWWCAVQDGVASGTGPERTARCTGRVRARCNAGISSLCGAAQNVAVDRALHLCGNDFTKCP